MHFGEIKQPKTLLISRNEQLYILKEVENQYVCHDLSVWNKQQKFTFAQSKGFPPKHNLPIRENNSLEQAAFWHKVPTPSPLFLHYVSQLNITDQSSIVCCYCCFLTFFLHYFYFCSNKNYFFNLISSQVWVLRSYYIFIANCSYLWLLEWSCSWLVET